MHREGRDDIADAAFAALRRDMVAEVAATASEIIPEFNASRPLSATVLEALGRVPRHLFVPPETRELAYENRPLPIGQGQTISQPYIVAFMSDLLAIRPGDRVLEVGTGCGYQTAVLMELGAEVYSIEIIEPLAKKAAATLEQCGYARAHTRIGDGYLGWPEHAPYDAVIVTASVSHIPPPLIGQLKPGGRLVLPLGEAYAGQELLLVEKDSHGKPHVHKVLSVRFVPLTGGH